MYEEFFGLGHPPFQISPDPEFLYPSRVHEEALEHIRFALNHFKGTCLVTGPVGSGKTTICRQILRELNPAAVDHALDAHTVVVLDSLNYIKGFRYQLYCAARAESTQHCVVRCVDVDVVVCVGVRIVNGAFIGGCPVDGLGPMDHQLAHQPLRHLHTQ